MFNKMKMSIVIMVGIGLLITSPPISFADEVHESEKIHVSFSLDEPLADKRIDELKKMDIVMEKKRGGRYIAFFIDKDGKEKMQVLTANEARELGYIENIVQNLPKNEVVLIEENNKHHLFVATIIDRRGNQRKQVITMKEANHLGYIEDVVNNRPDTGIIIERDKDGKYLMVLVDKKGKKVKQIITKEEAFELGFIENRKDLPKGNEIISTDKENSDLIVVIRDADGNILKQKINKDGIGETSFLIPETATSFYNMLLIGGVLLISGIVLFFRSRKMT